MNPGVERIDRLVAAFFAGLLALAAVDTVLVWSRSGSSSLVRYAASTVAASAWVALLVGGSIACAMVLARPVAERAEGRYPGVWKTLAGAAWGAAVALVVLLILRVWDLATDPYRLSTVVPVIAVAGGIVLRWLRDALSTRMWCLLMLAACASAFAVDAFVMRRLYLGFHNTAAFIAVLAAASFFYALNVCFARHRWLGVAALVSQAVILVDLRAARSIGVLEGTLQPKLIRVVQALADRDHDGFSSFLGGDCDDGDASIHPGRCEISGNGLDDNCNGLVDTEEPHTNGAPVVDNPETPVLTPDVYVVLSDATRGDFGRVPRGDVAPEIDAFAARSLDFQNAYTPYPSTYRAMIATLQGRHWRHVGAGHKSLLRLFAENGYDVQLWIERKRLLEPRSGSGVVSVDRQRGDPFHVPGSPDKTAWTGRLVDEAIDELAGTRDPPRFRWLHFLDTHAPRHRGRDGDSDLERYRAEVRHVSKHFGRLWRALQQTERGRQAVVVFVSDHGEEFGDHEGRFHGATLFQEGVWVPMLVHLPGIEPRTIAAPASLLDVAPTIVGYLGWTPVSGHQGVNHAENEQVPTKRVLSEVESLNNLGGAGLPALHMARDARHKVVLNVTDGLASLYDLDNDPDEEHDLYPAHPDKAEPLLDTIRRWQDRPGCVAR